MKLKWILVVVAIISGLVFADDKCIQYESETLRGGPATSKTSFQSWTKDVSFSDPVLDRYLLSFQNDQAQLFRFQFATVNRNTEEVLLLPTVYSASDLDSLGSTPRSIGRTIVDQNGNFIFFGDYFSSSDAKKKLFIAKYSPSFTKIWITTMQTAELAQDLFVGDIALLENGDFAIVGGSYGTITGSGATPNINDLQGFYGVVAGNNGTVRWVNQDSSTIQNYGANLLCKGVNLECYTIWKSLVQKTGEVRLYNFGTKAKVDAWTYTFNVRDSDGIILFRNNSYTNGVLVAFFAPSYKDELTISLLNEANDKFESLYSPVQFGTVDSSVTGNLAKTAYYDNNFNLYIIGSSKYNFPTQSMSSNPRGFIAKFQPSSLVYTVSVLSSTGAVSAESATILSEDNILVIGTTKGPLSSGDTLNSVQDIFLATYGPSDTLYGQSCSGDCITSCSVAYDVNSTITCRSGAFGDGQCNCPPGFGGANCQFTISPTVIPTQGGIGDEPETPPSEGLPVWAQAVIGAICGFIFLLLLLLLIICCWRHRKPKNELPPRSKTLDDTDVIQMENGTKTEVKPSTDPAPNYHEVVTGDGERAPEYKDVAAAT